MAADFIKRPGVYNIFIAKTIKTGGKRKQLIIPSEIFSTFNNESLSE